MGTGYEDVIEENVRRMWPFYKRLKVDVVGEQVCLLDTSMPLHL